MEYKRKPKESEITLLKYLIEQSSIDLPKDWAEKILVENMDDGGMGSLKLFLSDNHEESIFVRIGSDCSFIDEDGVTVIATLYLDSNGIPFELDMWKTDFSHLIHIPNKFGSI